jgi:hypothetical protein
VVCEEIIGSGVGVSSGRETFINLELDGVYEIWKLCTIVDEERG